MNVFEYFISQKIFPIIKQVLETEVQFLKNPSDALSFENMHKTPSGIDLIKKICSLKFKYKDAIELNDTYFDACKRLGELKEMGRAKSYYNILEDHNISFYEHLHPDPLGKGKRLALNEALHEEQLESGKSLKKTLTCCPVCNNKSQVEYELTTTFCDDSGRTYLNPVTNSWNNCFTCTFSMITQIATSPFIEDK